MPDLTIRSLSHILDGLRFPAERWAIVTQADLYGADAATCDRLRRLPVRTRPYFTVQEILDALESAPRGLPAVPAQRA